MFSRITSIREGQNIDLYAVYDGKIHHYYANPSTQWEYEREFIFQDFTVKSKVTAIRQGDYIDIYFVDDYNRLFHGRANKDTNWVYYSEIIYHGVNCNVDPVVVRLGEHIDLYCVNTDGNIIHLYAGQLNSWTYWSQIIFISLFYPVQRLCAVKTQADSIDIYFAFNDWIYHGNAKQHTGWKYEFQPVGKVNTKKQIFCTRYEQNIDVFAVDTADRLVHYFANDRNEWKYQRDNQLDIVTLNGNFNAIRYQDHINLYYQGAGGLFYTYVGIHSGWKWDPFRFIQLTDVKYDISVVRTPSAIDVYHITSDNKIIHSFIGQATNNNWQSYFSEELIYSCLVFKERINWEDIHQNCVALDQGYHATAFYHKKYGVIKRLRNANIPQIKQEVKILDRLKDYENGLCRYVVYENHKIIGFTIKHFPGQKYAYIISMKKNLYHSRMFKIRLIFQLAHQVKKIQKCKISHCDLSIENVLIDFDKDIDQYNYYEDIKVKIIDFGNSIDFSQTSQTDSDLTGYLSLRPPQIHKKPYNPRGINAYQFGRTSIHILKKLYGKQFKSEAYKHQNWQQDRKFLKQLSKRGYDPQFCKTILTLVSGDINARLDVLNQFFISAKLKEITYVDRYNHLKQNPQARHKFFNKKPKKKEQNQAIWVSTGSSKKTQFKDFGLQITNNWGQQKKDLPKADQKTKQVAKNTIINLASNTPYIGPLAGALVTLLFPSEQPDYSLIEDRIGHNAAKDIRKTLKGFKDLITGFWEDFKYYKEKVYYRHKLEQKWQRILDDFVKDKHHFLDSTFAYLIFSDFVAFANAHLLWIKLGIWMHQHWFSFQPRIKQKLDPLCRQYVTHGKRVGKQIQERWNSEKDYHDKLRGTEWKYAGKQMFPSSQFPEKKEAYLKKLKYIKNQQKTYNDLLKTVYNWIELASQQTRKSLKNDFEYQYVEFNFESIISYYKFKPSNSSCQCY